MLSGMDKKKILVTGCDSGFGKLYALRMANKGVTVFAACLTEAGMKNLNKESPRIKAFQMDVTNLDSVKKGFEFVSSQLGPNEGGIELNE